jgi:alkanesulfonate monooxygenase SsuD/methylene tetrahydromethanopterin reductase-like flavin-dependent oxidoreductase (luciferase family)
MTASSLHLAVALDGAGWHPAAWREPDARPAELTSPGYWVDLARRADGGGVDFVTVEDSLRLQSGRYDGADGRTDRVRGRLDANLIAARVAPMTRHVGLVPSVTVTHTEPFHLSKAIATLDYVSGGRAGVRVQISARAEEAALFGRRDIPADLWADRSTPEAQALLVDLFDEAADYVEVVRRLWDSWEDDAEIRDAATGRFVDRDKLHYVDFEGRWFSVRGPSITPRPPQGQPLVTALAHATLPYRLAARQADIVFVTPNDVAGARAIVDEIRREQQEAGRAGETLHVFADLVVLLDNTEAAATARRDRLDAAAGQPLRSDAHIFTGTPAGLADLLGQWASAGLSGFRLRPAALPHDLDAIVDGLVPELERRGLRPPAQTALTLRARLGLDRPANRYVA